MTIECCWIVAYDVSNSRRRYRVARLLEGRGQRIQRSVFELWSTPAAVIDLEQQLLRRIDPSTDSVRLYPLGREDQPAPGELVNVGWFIV